MKSFEEISKMNLAELDRPAGAGEEELETETIGAEITVSVMRKRQEHPVQMT